MSPAEWEVLARSLRVAATAVILSLPPGLILAYVLARGRVRFTFVLDNLIQLPLVLPPVVTGYLLLVLLGPTGWIGRLLPETWQVPFTWFGAVLAAAVVAFPLLVQTIRVAFEQVDRHWEEAVYVYGGGRWAAFRWVTGPLAARGIVAGMVLAFARAFGEFGATIVLAGNIPGRTQTLPLAIFTRLNQVQGEEAALRLVVIAVGVSVLSLMLYALLVRRLPRGGSP